MSSDVAIRVEGLGKAYTIRHQHNDHVTLAQVALERAKHPLRRTRREEFWALHDVDFEVRQGEVLGVIGRNGAGKSTLLKLLTRITAPTTGRIDLWGRVGSLLEVGTGFHPELTGRENIYLNGSILGMARREIDRQFDAIVDFAGVERFLDTPVKRYSSGMYVRLAFAVAAHLETEILLVDEVLAVGDADFQAKCLGKVTELAGDGRTVLLVSHNMSSIAAFSDRALLLEQGGIVSIDTADEVIAEYLRRAGSATTAVQVDGRSRPQKGLGQNVRMTEVILANTNGIVGASEPLRVRLHVRVETETAPLRFGQQVTAADGSTVGTTWSKTAVALKPGATSVVDLEMHDHRLAPGTYELTMSVGTGDGYTGVQDHDLLLNLLAFEVSPLVTPDGTVTGWNWTWGASRLPAPAVVEVTELEPSAPPT